LEFFKIRNKPLAAFVTNRINQTQAALEYGANNPLLSSEIIDKCNSQRVNPNGLKPYFKQAYQLALNKWNKHIQHHSALPLFRDIQCFDPRFIRTQINRQNIILYVNIIEFQNPANVLLDEWSIYCRMEEIIEEGELDLDKYWNEKSITLPNLSKIALIYIWLPVAGVDVERSFSDYKNILSEKRMRLSEKSISMLNLLYHNQN